MSIHPALSGPEAAAAAGLEADFVPCKSLLSDKAILAHMAKGTVLIEPFDIDNLSTSRSATGTDTGLRRHTQTSPALTSLGYGSSRAPPSK